MIHSATASARLSTPVRLSPTSCGTPIIGADLPTVSSSAVIGGEIYARASSLFLKLLPCVALKLKLTASKRAEH